MQEERVSQSRNSYIYLHWRTKPGIAEDGHLTVQGKAGTSDKKKGNHSDSEENTSRNQKKMRIEKLNRLYT